MATAQDVKYRIARSNAWVGRKWCTQMIEEVQAAGIHVFSSDAEIASPDGYFVGIDQKEWAKLSLKWLAGKIGSRAASCA